MNVKTLAALVGTLSLGSLATGCATTSTSAATMEKGAEGSCGAKGAEASCNAAKGAEASCKAAKGAEASCKAAATEEDKGGHAGCGASGCGAPSK